jgi:hypothetical protein
MNWDSAIDLKPFAEEYFAVTRKLFQRLLNLPETDGELTEEEREVLSNFRKNKRKSVPTEVVPDVDDSGDTIVRY